MNFLKILFTDGSNQDIDYARVFGAVALGFFLFMSVHSYVSRNAAFDPIAWASGAAIIIGVATGASKLPDKTIVKDNIGQ